jgi:hypothetical protein
MIIPGPMLAVLIVIYPQSDSDPPPHCPATKGERLNDVSPAMGLVRCKSTKSDVEAKLGKPRSERVTGIGTEVSYGFPNGSLATFLFAPDGLLLQTLVYAE